MHMNRPFVEEKKRPDRVLDIFGREIPGMPVLPLTGSARVLSSLPPARSPFGRGINIIADRMGEIVSEYIAVKVRRLLGCGTDEDLDRIQRIPQPVTPSRAQGDVIKPQPVTSVEVITSQDVLLPREWFMPKN